MKDSPRLPCQLLLACLLGAATIAAAQEAVVLEAFRTPDVPGFKPVLLADLPDFMAEVSACVTKTGEVHPSGLVSTINHDQFKEPAAPAKELKFSLEVKETGFRSDLKVRLFLQPKRAPLAVLLLGFSQASDDLLARAWQTHLYEAGCHVLSFDSLIRNNMNRVTHHGVAGNYIAEGTVCATIIRAALHHPCPGKAPLKEQVSSVRLLGTSWGGLLAQQVLRTPEAAQWPIDRCLILSTPVCVQTSAELLDRYAKRDYPKHPLAELARLANGFTPEGKLPTPTEESLMRAGIGYVFHGDLKDIARGNLERYRRELPAGIQALLQRDDWRLVIDTWDFHDYIYLLGRPYWRLKNGQLFPSALPLLLEKAPNFVQAFLAKDDPLCEPQAIEEAAARMRPGLLTVLPHGGHLGYAGTRWVRALIKRYFATPNPLPAQPPAPAKN